MKLLKLRKYLKVNNFTLTFKKSYVREQTHGRGWYNDGTELICEYILDINSDNTYLIESKETGRVSFFIYKNGKWLQWCKNQRDLIEVINEEFENVYKKLYGIQYCVDIKEIG